MGLTIFNTCNIFISFSLHWEETLSLPSYLSLLPLHFTLYECSLSSLNIGDIQWIKIKDLMISLFLGFSLFKFSFSCFLGLFSVFFGENMLILGSKYHVSKVLVTQFCKKKHLIEWISRGNQAIFVEKRFTKNILHNRLIHLITFFL